MDAASDEEDEPSQCTAVLGVVDGGDEGVIVEKKGKRGFEQRNILL